MIRARFALSATDAASPMLAAKLPNRPVRRFLIVRAASSLSTRKSSEMLVGALSGYVCILSPFRIGKGRASGLSDEFRLSSLLLDAKYHFQESIELPFLPRILERLMLCNRQLQNLGSLPLHSLSRCFCRLLLQR